jgi:hypothetical protein
MAARLEHYDDPIEAHRVALTGHQSGMWTAMPAIITAYDPARMTVSAQPAIKAKQRETDGTIKDVQMPLCVDVPVVFPRGGGFSLTFPIAAGDEVLLVFASRCIDGWWDQGGVQNQIDQRMHDLSDAFAIPGPWSQKTRITGAMTGAQLRSGDGATVVEVSAGKVTLTATNVVINGNLAVTGTTMTHNAHDVGYQHKHTAVQTGGSLSGVPQ